MRRRRLPLVLVAGSGRSSDLTERIADILRNTYEMEGVETLLPVPKKDPSIPRSPRSPFFVGRFADKEPQIEMGQETLDSLKGTYTVVVKHMYEPTDDPSVNTHLMETLLLFDVVGRAPPERRMLAVPYLSFLRSHNVPKYQQMGFQDANSLSLMATMFKNVGIDVITAIDPHSSKIVDECRDRGIEFQVINPFYPSKYVNLEKHGLVDAPRDRKVEVLKSLQPWIEYFKRRKAENKEGRIYLIIPDDGAETRVERFGRDCGLDFDDIGYILKRPRQEAGRAEIQGFKSFCRKRMLEILKSATEYDVFVIPDDMISGAGTQNEIAQYLKKHGAKRVEGWCSHAVCPDPSKLDGATYLDGLVSLDTVYQENLPKRIEVIPASDALLCGEIFKSYMKYTGNDRGW